MPFYRQGGVDSGGGVTNGDLHDHNGGDGAQIDHTTLSNIGTKTHAQIDAALGYSLHFGSTSGTSPADGSTFYFSHTRWSSANSGYITVTKAGNITAFYGHCSQTVASAENCTLELFKNGVSVATLSNTIQLTAAVVSFSNTGLNIAVVAGDYLELKWTSPAWATNPTGWVLSGDLWVAT